MSAKAPGLWAAFPQALAGVALWIWLGMSGNGVTIGMVPIPLMLSLILVARLRVMPAYYEAVRGIMGLPEVTARTVTVAILTSAVTSAGSVAHLSRRGRKLSLNLDSQD